MKISIARSRSSVALGLAALVVGLTTGTVLSHGGDTTLIHACVNNAGSLPGAVRIVGENVSCRSNETAVHWNIQGQRGPVGPQGDPGPAGQIGPAGLQGDTGPAGPAGADGVSGAPGPQGDPGAQGEQGPMGPAGPQGEQGLQGELGPAGTQGEVGPLGPAGTQGEVGPIGPAGTQGEVGPMGAAGSNGEQGPMGPAGPSGPQGAAGQGIVGVHTVSAVEPFNPLSDDYIVLCPPGEIVLGGGGESVIRNSGGDYQRSQQLVLTGSIPEGPGWNVNVRPADNGPMFSSVRIWVVCGQVSE